MYLIRDVFQAKPGKAKEIVAIFKKAMPYMERLEGTRNPRIMTDVVAQYWTVVLEAEVENLDQFAVLSRTFTSQPELAENFKGYTELIEGGRREVYRLE